MKHLKQFDNFNKVEENEEENVLNTVEYKRFLEACDQYDFNEAFEIAQEIGLFGGDFQEYIEARTKQMPGSGLMKAYEAYTIAANKFKEILVSDIEDAQTDYGHNK